MPPPEFDITALMLGDAKAERDSDRALAYRRGEVSDGGESDGHEKAAINAEEQAARDRTIGSAAGSGISNFATGYGLSPLLVKAYGGDSERALDLGKLRKAPGKHLKKIYGKGALVSGAVLSGAALAGGAIREQVQSSYERGARKARLKKKREAEALAGTKTAGTLLEAVAAGAKQDWDNGGCADFVAAGKANYDFLEARIAKEAEEGSSSMGSGALNRVTGSITKPPTDYELLSQRLKKRKGSDGVERRSSKTAAKGPTGYGDRASPEQIAAMSQQAGLSVDEIARRSGAAAKAHYESGRKVRNAGYGAAAGAVGASFIPGVRGRTWARRGLRIAAVPAAATGYLGEYGMHTGQRFQDLSESARAAKKTAAFGIMAYTRDPGEAPKSKRPEKPKGRAAAMFGARMDPNTALHKRTEREGEKWHADNSEFVEIGDRPGLSGALGEIMGLEPGQVLSRREVSKMIGETDTVRTRSHEYRRSAKKQERNATHVPGDTSEVVKALKLMLENPKSKFFEVVES